MACIALAGLAIAVFFLSAARLVSYPWDWESGEGLSLNYARRLLSDPASLYPPDAVTPVPLVYTPLLPTLLAPLTRWPSPIAGARVLAIAWTLAALAATYLLIRRRASRAIAVVGCGLILAHADTVFWLTCVRVDGLMIALWLWAAVLVLPDPSRTSLSWRRSWAGAALMVAAALAKPTAVVYGAPIVCGWLLVHRPSALRLGCAVLALGGACLAVLQFISSGGFWRCLALQLHFPQMPGQMANYTVLALHDYAPLVAVTTLVLVLSIAKGTWRDSSWLLWLSGPLTIPMLGKMGAGLNYLLPWLVAQSVLFGRLAGATADHAFGFRTLPKVRIDLLACLAGGVATAVTLHAQEFPLPSAQDETTAAAFYSFVKDRGAPVLAAGPDLAYEAVGQSAAIEWVTYPMFAQLRPRGLDVLRDRVARGEYQLIVEKRGSPRLTGPGYRLAGACALGFAVGQFQYALFVPRSSSAAFAYPSGARCWAPGP